MNKPEILSKKPRIQSLQYLSLGAATIYLVIAAVLLNGSLNSLGAVKQQLNTTNSQLNNAEFELANFHEDYPRYQALQQRGVIGSGNRLNWIETLESIGATYNIPSIDFTVDNTMRADELHPLYANSNDRLSTTGMALRLKMKHEGDWYHLLKQLRQEANGLFSVEFCHIQTRLAEFDEVEGLDGACDLEWYSLSELPEAEHNQ